MSKLIEIYGVVLCFCIFVLIMIGVVGVGIYYKPVSDATIAVVEIIETNEGVNSNAANLIQQMEQELDRIDVELVEFPLTDDYKRYEVIVSTKLVIPVINLEIPIISSKTTKKVIY